MRPPCEAASAETRPDQTDRTEKKRNDGAELLGKLKMAESYYQVRSRLMMGSVCLSVGLQNNNTGGFVLFAALIVIMQSGDRDRFELREGRGSMVTASRAATAKGGDRSLISGYRVFFFAGLFRLQG